MKITDLEDRVSSAYASKTKADQKAIDPAVIAMIIDTIMKLIQSCTANNNTPKGIKDYCAKRPVLARLAVRRQMTQSDLDRKDSREVIETVIRVGLDATEQDIADVLTMPLFVQDPAG